MPHRRYAARLEPVHQRVQRVAREDADQQRHEETARKVQSGDQREKRQPARRQVNARVASGAVRASRAIYTRCANRPIHTRRANWAILAGRAINARRAGRAGRGIHGSDACLVHNGPNPARQSPNASRPENQ